MGNEKLVAKHYTPFGPEWEKEMNNFPKKQLISMLGKAYKSQQLNKTLMGLLEEQIMSECIWYSLQQDTSLSMEEAEERAKIKWQSYCREHNLKTDTDGTGSL